MAAFKGREFVIGRLVGAAYVTVAGGRSVSMTLNGETVDITDQQSAPWRTLLEDAGIRSMSLSLSGVFTDDASMATMMADVMAGSIESYQLSSEAGDSFTGSFQITSCERSGEYGGEEQFSISLESSGEIIYAES